MTQGHAVMIEQNDLDVICYYANAMDPYAMRGYSPMFPPPLEVVLKVKERAAQLAALSAAIEERILSALRAYVTWCEGLSGRKMIFFHTDFSCSLNAATWSRD